MAIGSLSLMNSVLSIKHLNKRPQLFSCFVRNWTAAFDRTWAVSFNSNWTVASDSQSALVL